MSTTKLTRHQETKRIMRHIARSKIWHAEPVLRQLTPAQVEAFQGYITVREGLQQVLGGFALLAAIFPIAVAMANGLNAALSAICIVLCLEYIILYFSTIQSRYALYALTQTDNPRVLPTLIMATKHNWDRHPQVQDAMLRLLEQVTEEHLGLLNNAAQEQLWLVAMRRRAWPANNDHELMLPAMRALAVVGNRAMLTRMKQFVTRSRRLNVLQDTRTIVQDLIPVMEARLERQQVPETLLRAADVPASAPDMLLRSTLAASPEPSEQMLRASRSEGE